MVKCSFCGEVLLPGRGKMYVQVDGRIFYFDKAKCERNIHMGREGATTKWTKLWNKSPEAKAENVKKATAKAEKAATAATAATAKAEKAAAAKAAKK